MLQIDSLNFEALLIRHVELHFMVNYIKNNKVN
jgi:hypothetical protein